MKASIFTFFSLFIFSFTYSQKKESIELTNKKETVIKKEMDYELITNKDSTEINDTTKKRKKQTLFLEKNEKPKAVKAKATPIK